MFSYFLIRGLTWPLQFLSYSALHKLGAWLGRLAYYLLPKFRKRTLSNLSLANTLVLSRADKIRVAKGALESLMITCLEYAKFDREKEIQKVARCLNPETADRLMREGKPVIFFCGHQANWEVLFLEGTSRMPGVAIGRPVKNTRLYNWVLGIRQKYGGKIVPPQQAIKEGLRALKQGAFLGIVGDQGRPDSGYASPFFGRRAWTSPMPALLSYRTGSPVMVATTRRTDRGQYEIRYSDPIWPDPSQPMEKEIDRMMREMLHLFEESIREAPEQWLWAHNRWKQQTLGQIKRVFRQECFCIVMPEENGAFERVKSALSTFREIYPLEFITLFVPRGKEGAELEDAEVIFYGSLDEVFVPDDRFKLIYNFSNDARISRHFLKLSAVKAVDENTLHRLSGLDPNLPLAQHLKQAVCHAS